jgi:hypothetical protein
VKLARALAVCVLAGCGFRATGRADAAAGSDGGDCGAGARKVAQRTVDAMVKEDCAGCACTDWRVYGCYAETQSYGAPWADIAWQVGFEALRFAVTTAGRVVVTGSLPTDVITPQQPATVDQLDLVHGGTVEIDLVVDAARDDALGGRHQWHLHGHVVDVCP